MNLLLLLFLLPSAVSILSFTALKLRLGEGFGMPAVYPFVIYGTALLCAAAMLGFGMMGAAFAGEATRGKQYPLPLGLTALFIGAGFLIVACGLTWILRSRLPIPVGMPWLWLPTAATVVCSLSVLFSVHAFDYKMNRDSIENIVRKATSDAFFNRLNENCFIGLEPDHKEKGVPYDRVEILDESTTTKRSFRLVFHFLEGGIKLRQFSDGRGWKENGPVLIKTWPADTRGTESVCEARVILDSSSKNPLIDRMECRMSQTQK